MPNCWRSRKNSWACSKSRAVREVLTCFTVTRLESTSWDTCHTPGSSRTRSWAFQPPAESKSTASGWFAEAASSPSIPATGTSMLTSLSISSRVSRCQSARRQSLSLTMQRFMLLRKSRNDWGAGRKGDYSSSSCRPTAHTSTCVRGCGKIGSPKRLKARWLKPEDYLSFDMLAYATTQCLYNVGIEWVINFSDCC